MVTTAFNIFRKSFYVSVVIFCGILECTWAANGKTNTIAQDITLEGCPSFTQLGQDIDGETVGDQSGYSVSMSADGTRVAIGAIWNDGNGIDSGHVRVYEYNGSIWNQLGQDIDGEAAGDRSGHSVSLSADGTRVAIGARGNDENGSNSGHVRVYEYNAGVWNQLGVDLEGEATNDQMGYAVALSADGTHVAIGAIWNDGNGSDSGHVRIYEYIGSAWIQLGVDIDGEDNGDQIGHSVSLSADGTRVAMGAIWNDGNGIESGHVRVYEYNGSTWNQLGVDLDGEAAGDASGRSVSLSADGNRLAIGATRNAGNGSNSGHVRVYEYIGSAWNQLGVDIDGEAANDASGRSVSLSADGSRVAIGATGNDNTSANSGHVRIYEYIGSAWNQLGVDIDGEAVNDASGHSVSLSADGTRVAIGAIGNAGNGSDSGHVRVYGCDLPVEECKNAGQDGTLTVCEGTTPSDAELFTQLIGADPGGSWSGPVSGVYTYTLAASGSCPEDSATVTVTEDTKPAQVVTTVNISSGEQYIWTVNGETYTTAQDITIEGDNCEADQRLVLTITEGTMATVFQVPLSDILSLDLNISYDTTINVNFQDISGRTVLISQNKNVSVGTNHLEYNMATLAAQALIMNIYTDREIISKKVFFIR